MCFDDGADNHGNNRTLTGEDLFAGVCLTSLGLCGTIFNVLVARQLYKLGRNFTGFRFLLSQACAETLLFIQFGMYNGVLVLLQCDPLPVGSRTYVQLYLDFAWFSTVWHYPLVALSRFWAIMWPVWFKDLSIRKSYILCALVWMAGFFQSAIMRAFDWYVVFFYSAEAYGTVSADFQKYKTEGQASYFMGSHVLLLGVAVCLYGCTVVALLRTKQTSRSAQQRSNAHPSSTTLLNANTKNKTLTEQTRRQNSVSAEKRLVVSCALHTLLFIIGQVMITVGVASGKWVVFSIMCTFMCNALLNPCLLICMCTALRVNLCNYVMSIVCGVQRLVTKTGYGSEANTNGKSADMDRTPVTVSRNINHEFVNGNGNHASNMKNNDTSSCMALELADLSRSTALSSSNGLNDQKEEDVYL